MYEYIKGIYRGINEDYVVVENNGIGYKIHTSGSTITSLPKINENIIVYTIQIVREDFIGLYGFSTKDELDLFNLFLKVNGVGPKAALSLLSISGVDSLKRAVIIGEENLIIKAPGIGKKIAQRIILELKDKIHLDEDVDEFVSDKSQGSKMEREALQALVSLGYTEREANKALKYVGKQDSVENIIKECLKYLMS